MARLSRIAKGTVVEARIIVRDFDRVANKLEDDEQDLTGCSVYVTIRKTLAQTAVIAIAKSSLASGGIVVDPDQALRSAGGHRGEAVVTFDVDDTKDLASGTYYMDIQVKDDTGRPREGLAPVQITIAEVPTRLYA